MVEIRYNVFNFEKYSQQVNEVAHDLNESIDQSRDNLANPDKSTIDSSKRLDINETRKDPSGKLNEKDKDILDRVPLVGYIDQVREDLTKRFGPIDENAWAGFVRHLSPGDQNLVSDNSIQNVLQDVQDQGLNTPAQNLMNSQQTNALVRETIAKGERYFSTLKQMINRQQSRQFAPRASDESEIVVAQIAEPMPEQSVENSSGSRFPVSGLGDFIDKFFDDLTAWNGQGKQYDAISNAAVSEIQEYVGEGFEQEANSALKSIQQMNGERDAEDIGCILSKVYSYWLSPSAKRQDTGQMERSIMSETNTPKGIIKFNLSDHVLNNQGMQKTASVMQDGSPYLLYGPTEKRICPKLSGKNIGNVVSEYICRHHCLDGIAIDDNKTICGEAIWRANVMDKQNREYVDKEGNITGGYIEKRFEVDHTTVPEENKIRLKPGEIRKPRPASWGNMESRLQDMRNKEGEKRGYRPNTDTSKPFNWSKDVDQNNVEQTQKERDKREKDSGHELVEYTNKDKAENNPQIKKSFNLKAFKTGSGDVDFLRQIEKSGGHIEISPQIQDQIASAQKSNWVEVRGNVARLTEVGKRVLQGAGNTQVPGMTNLMNDQSKALHNTAVREQQGVDSKSDVVKDQEKQRQDHDRWLENRQQGRESVGNGENHAVPTSGTAKGAFNLKQFKSSQTKSGPNMVRHAGIPGVVNTKEEQDEPIKKETNECKPCNEKKKDIAASTILPKTNPTNDPIGGKTVLKDDNGIITHPQMRKTRQQQLEHLREVEDTAKALAME